MVQTTDLNLKSQRKLSAADRLLEAAGPLFADRPFGVVSTREIANAAKVNLSAISYHFGSKEGLYDAVFQKLLNDLAPVRQRLAIFIGTSIPDSLEQPERQREIVRLFVGNLIDSITSVENPRWRMRLMIREIQQSGRCFDRIMKEHINVIHDLVGQMVASITGRPAASREVKIMSHTIIGMCLQFGLNEALFSHRMGWDRYGPEETSFIKEQTANSILAILGIPVSSLTINSE